MRKLVVKLLTTLKGDDLYMNGSTFTGAIHELPREIREAVENEEQYITVREIEVEEEVFIEQPVPAVSTVADSKEKETEGESTPEEKKLVESKSEQPVKKPVRRARKKTILKPKE